MEKACHQSPGQPCAGLFCPQDRTYLGLTIQKDGNEEVTEAFCVCTWTPDQFAALRAFIQGGAGSLPMPDDLKQIEDPPLRLFHLLSSLYGPETMKRFYALGTIKVYRRRLRAAGFDYPVRSTPTGPRLPRVKQDVGLKRYVLNRQKSRCTSNEATPSGGSL